VPVLDQIVGRRPAEIRALFETYRLTLQEWDRAHTDRLTIREAPASPRDILVIPAG
jgi:hypothetical protein